MKKVFHLFAAIGIIAIFSTTANAQKSSGSAPAFDVGSNTIGVSLGFGVDYDYYGSVTPWPALCVSYDHGIVGNVGPGTIGIGGIIGVKTAHYNYGYDNYSANWTNFIIGARGTYHLTILKDMNNKFDPYAGLMLGIRIDSWSDSYYAAHPNDAPSYNSVYPVVGAFIGAKYNFSKSVGAYAELGYDISFARIGVNFNF